MRMARSMEIEATRALDETAIAPYGATTRIDTRCTPDAGWETMACREIVANYANAEEAERGHRAIVRDYQTMTQDDFGAKWIPYYCERQPELSPRCSRSSPRPGGARGEAPAEAERPEGEAAQPAPSPRCFAAPPVPGGARGGARTAM
jgi:hypothetical protein